MEALWYILVALMLAAYVVLDGFDLGVGIIQQMITRNDDERRVILQTVESVWNGNEVWLVAAAGALYFAFPLLYAPSFSGFYLSLMMVAWLLLMRGVAVELRSHLEQPFWRAFSDFVFSLSSLLLSFFYGVAMGNVIRGVPLVAGRHFFEPLWTDFRVGPNPGILDWYSVLIGILACAALAVHGAHYVALKTEGDLQSRARGVARLSWLALVILTVLALKTNFNFRPRLLDNFHLHVWGGIFPAVVVVTLIAIPFFQFKRRDLAAFLSSTAYLAAMLAGAAFMMYPFLLPASASPANSLTMHNASTGAYSLRVGLVWWLVGLVLAAGYFFFLYRSFRSKVDVDSTR